VEKEITLTSGGDVVTVEAVASFLNFVFLSGDDTEEVCIVSGFNCVASSDYNNNNKMKLDIM